MSRRTARRPPVQSPTLIANVARTATTRRSRRPEPGSTLRTITRGPIEIDVIERYIIDNGLTGTAGPPTNAAQAMGSVWTVLRGKPVVSTPVVSKNQGILEASAVVGKLPEGIFDDILKAASLANEWERILFEWEGKLLTGVYKIYKCVDFGHSTSAGGYNLIVGISTSEFRLRRYQDDVLGSDFEISFWKTIQGKKPWPAPAANAPRPVRYATIKQG